MRPKLNLPQPRRLFIPEPDHVLLECDLAGADARVTAHECGGKFREDFFSGVKIHEATMQAFFPTLPVRQDPEYTRCKNLLYGTIYGGKPPTISAESGAPLAIAKAFQPWIFNKYPEIPQWQRAKVAELYKNGGVSNAFGLRVYYFNRLESVIPEALNWVPSSTVAEVCFRGIKLIRRAALAGHFPSMIRRIGSYLSFIGCRLQVHDSAIFMFPLQNWPDYAIRIRDLLHSIQVPYPNDPLIIPWSFKASTKSWADAKEVDWTSMELDDVAIPAIHRVA
jgi:hypothetical protein